MPHRPVAVNACAFDGADDYYDYSYERRHGVDTPAPPERRAGDDLVTTRSGSPSDP